MNGDLRRILVACPGELAKRLIATYHRLGIEVVVAFSAAEAEASWLEDADYDVYLGDGPTVWSDVGRVIAAAMDSGCDAVHPGYGALARSRELYAEATAVNLAVIGIDPAKAEMSLNRSVMLGVVDSLGFQVPPWDVVAAVDEVGTELEVEFPMVVQPRVGGPGRRVEHMEQLADAVAAAREQSDGSVLMLQEVSGGTPIEVVVAGDQSGRVVPLALIVGTEILELAIDDPHPWLGRRSVIVAEHLRFVGIGSFRYRMTAGEIAWFMGFDPHLPPSYDLIERVCDLDLVELQHHLVTGRGVGEPPIRLTCGVQAQIRALGAGTVAAFEEPRVEGVDLASVLVVGASIGVHDEPLLAKLTTTAPDLVSARATLWEALHGLRIEGVPTRLAELRQAFGPSGPIASA